MERYGHFYGGCWHKPHNGEFIETENPFTEEPWALIPRGDKYDVDNAVDAAHTAFKSKEWGAISASERGRLLRKLGEAIDRHADELAITEVKDNGKLITEMAAQMKYIPKWYDYFAGMADKVNGAVLPCDKSEVFNYTRYEPLGVVAAIVPWNSPLMIATWKMAPALAAGNTVVLKPSEFTSSSAFELAKIVEAIGFPKGVINVVSGYGNEAGEALVTHPLVKKVAFTGGTETGQKIYEMGAAGIKRVTLELGGKSPNIVFDDCRIDNAVKGVISGIFAATGQTCIAGSRLLLQRSIHDEFVEKLVAFAKGAKMGDPLEESTQVGPVTTRAQYEKILSYIDIAKSEGAEAVLGGGKGDFPTGRFIEPTIFVGVKNSMRIAREEVFGPVLSIIPFDDDEEALFLANESKFGLAAGLWTEDVRRMLHFSHHLEAGSVWVNTYRMFSYLSPFGGYKASGIGREGGKDAIYDYLQEKSIWISTQERVANPFVMKL